MRTIPLTLGLSAIVDDHDFLWLSRFKWHAVYSGTSPYAVRSITEGGRKRRIRMHREIVAAPPELVVDHINRITLDNRRSNLRACTQSVNLTNTPNAIGKGAYLCRMTGRFHARFSHDCVRYHVGRFATKEAADAAVEAGRAALQAGRDPSATVIALRETGRVYRASLAQRSEAEERKAPPLPHIRAGAGRTG